MTPALPRSLRSLQIGRGLAALFVVLFHLNNSVWSIGKYFPDPFSQVLGFGNAGVQFFFVLSGFIIYLVHSDDIQVPTQFRRFVFKRFVRVYPTYWVVLFTVVAALFMDPALGMPGEREVSRIVASALLIPYPQDPIVGVAWTLEHEVLFYAIFSISILNARFGRVVFVVWQVACLANTVFGSHEFPYRVIFSANNLLFSFGLAMAYLFRNWRCPAPGWVAAGGAIAVAILGACNYERLHDLRAPRLLDVIGDASYSIYLIHLPLLSIFAKALFMSGLSTVVPQALSLLMMLSAVVAVGVTFSKLVEMPLIAALGRFQTQRRRVVVDVSTLK